MLAEFTNALKAGEEISNPTVWKDRQKLVSNIIVIVGFVIVLLPMFGINVKISSDEIVQISGAIASIVGIANSYLVIATSKKMGLSKNEDANEKNI